MKVYIHYCLYMIFFQDVVDLVGPVVTPLPPRTLLQVWLAGWHLGNSVFHQMCGACLGYSGHVSILCSSC